MSKRNVLIQFDTDPKPSVFDAMVAIDAGVDHLLQYGGVTPEEVRGLVHGAMFTRGPQDLHHTAIFIGGGSVPHGEAIAQAARETLSQPFSVSIMLDSNGSNSTAAAAVLSAGQHVHFPDSFSTVLAATGPVGQRVCRILANLGGKVFVGSRSMKRSEETIALLARSNVDTSRLIPLESEDKRALADALHQSQAVYGCGAAGIQLLSAAELASATQLKVAIDLNAVSPAGLEGIHMMDKGVQRGVRFDYGALGVGALKMKIHKASIAALFEKNHRYLDCEEMLTIGADILSKQKSG